MSDAILKYARGTTTQCEAYTGPEGEIIVDTVYKNIRVQDGVTAGGNMAIDLIHTQLNISGKTKFTTKYTYGVTPPEGDRTDKFATTEWAAKELEAYSPPQPPEITSPTGRKLRRHENYRGSVIKYVQFGVEHELFVADAYYRGYVDVSNGKQTSTELAVWNHNYYPTCTGNVIDSSTGATTMTNIEDLTPYAAQFSDTHFAQALAATLAPVIKTAAESTDVLLASGISPAATYCRGLDDMGGLIMSVPNIYQAMVIRAEGDILDALDPSVDSDTTFSMGYNADVGGRGRRIVSSTFARLSASSTSGEILCCSGGNLGIYPYYTPLAQSILVPVCELS